MDDERNSLRVQSKLALAKVARQFAGSRIERQLLAQVFDVVWQARRSWSCPMANDHFGRISGVPASLAATCLSKEGGLT